MAEIQETQFVFKVDVRVRSDNYVVYSAYGNRLARDVSLLAEHTLGAGVDLVRVDAVESS